MKLSVTDTDIIHRDELPDVEEISTPKGGISEGKEGPDDQAMVFYGG